LKRRHSVRGQLAHLIPLLWGGKVANGWQVMKVTLFPAARLAAPRTRVYGLDRVPESGAGILVSNHSAAIDPFLISSFSRRALRFWVKSEVADRPWLGTAVGWTGGISVRRGSCPPSTLEQAREVLRQGEMLAIFPEGTRQRRPELGPSLQPGVASLALRERVPLIPCAIDSHGWSLKRNRKPCHLVFGSPLVFDDLPRTRAGRQELCDRLRVELERLLALAQEASLGGAPAVLSDGTRRAPRWAMNFVHKERSHGRGHRLRRKSARSAPAS
jgi:1-acyl-sn-glycerol-3-phosphate acyltransferase